MRCIPKGERLVTLHAPLYTRFNVTDTIQQPMSRVSFVLQAARSASKSSRSSSTHPTDMAKDSTGPATPYTMRPTFFGDISTSFQNQ